MDLRYPIGQFDILKKLADEQLLIWLDEIESLPRCLNQITRDLTEQQSADY